MAVELHGSNMAVRPNIVWITLDSVRTDHTTPGGYKRNTTPQLQALVDESEGHYHDHCIAHSRWSLPSITSILTGTYPEYHQTGLENNVLVDEITTIPERLQKEEYTTACLSRNPHLSNETNLNRGFDRFEYIQASNLPKTAGLRTTVKFLLNIRRHSAGFSTEKYAHSTPFIVNDVAKRWIRNFVKADNPFFFYLHYNEPHTPYYPPLPYLDMYTDNLEQSAKEAAQRVMDIEENKMEHIANQLDYLTEEDYKAMRAMYDAEIRYTDDLVGRLIGFIRSHVDRPTIFAVTADHGDLFGEYGMLAHKYVLHDGLIRVPMITHGYGVEDDLIQHADFARSIVELAGGDTEGLHGYDLRKENREFAVAQTGTGDITPLRKHNPEYENPHIKENQVDVVWTPEYKYRSTPDNGELFKLPNQEIDRAEDHPEIAEGMAEKITSWKQSIEPVSNRQQREYSDEMKEQLRNLGYHE